MKWTISSVYLAEFWASFFIFFSLLLVILTYISAFQQTLNESSIFETDLLYSIGHKFRECIDYFLMLKHNSINDNDEIFEPLIKEEKYISWVAQASLAEKVF